MRRKLNITMKNILDGKSKSSCIISGSSFGELEKLRLGIASKLVTSFSLMEILRDGIRLVQVPGNANDDYVNGAMVMRIRLYRRLKRLEESN